MQYRSHLISDLVSTISLFYYAGGFIFRRNAESPEKVCGKRGKGQHGMICGECNSVEQWNEEHLKMQYQFSHTQHESVQNRRLAMQMLDVYKRNALYFAGAAFGQGEKYKD